MNKFRCNMAARVRGVRRVQGSKGGRSWDFYSVDVLDEDDNKLEMALADSIDPRSLVDGERYWFTVDGQVNRGYLNLRVNAVDSLTDVAVA